VSTETSSHNPQELQMTDVGTESTWHFEWVRPLALRSIVGALIAAALIGVVSVIVGDFSELSWRAIGTVTVFVGFALVSWYDADVSAKRATWFGGVSVAVSIYLLLVSLGKIWFPGDRDTLPLLTIVGLAAVARVALLHIHLLLNIYRRFSSDTMRTVSHLTFWLVAVLAVMLSLPMLFTNLNYTEGYWRTVGAVAILDTLGTILVPLVHALFGSKSEALPAPVAAPSATERLLSDLPAPPATPARPAAAAYAPLNPAPAPLRLAWPRYDDGRPLPARPDGSPDFTGVLGY
jgi:hypothetical protein